MKLPKQPTKNIPGVLQDRKRSGGGGVAGLFAAILAVWRFAQKFRIGKIGSSLRVVDCRLARIRCVAIRCTATNPAPPCNATKRNESLRIAKQNERRPVVRVFKG